MNSPATDSFRLGATSFDSLEYQGNGNTVVVSVNTSVGQ